ncbi:MAG: antibiotic biosynthesis monooxygenase [Chloroflexota bacterium]
MADKRELLNRIERIPAAPGQLFVLREYNSSDAAFEPRWYAFAALQIAQRGCRFVRLHRDLEQPSQLVTFDLWQSRRALVTALQTLPDKPIVSGVAHQTFLRLAQHVSGSRQNDNVAKVGQVVSLRHFWLKVGSERQFERLWTESAKHESQQAGCLHKRLYRDLNLPTHYVSYSLWANRAAPDEAASQHAHYQSQHTPYPLTSPVRRATLDVIATLAP